MSTDSQTVTLSTDASVTVHPLGVRHFAKAARTLGSLGPRLAKIAGPRGELSMAAVLPLIFELALTDLWDLVRACTTTPDGVTLDDLPAWDAAAIADAWLELNFEDPTRRQPFVALAKRAMRTFTGADLTSLMPSESSSMSSPSSSPADTAAPT
jgi:hypothetical protein